MLASEQFITQSFFDQQASHCKACGVPVDVKSPILPWWIVHIKDTHTHFAADRDRPSSADVPATALSLFACHKNLGLFPETCTKLNSDSAYNCYTLGLQMDRDGEEGVPVFLDACLGKLGNSWLLCQLQFWREEEKKKSSKPESCQWFHSVHETGLLRVCV